MPATTQTVPVTEARTCVVNKNGVDNQAFVLDRRPGDIYVHYAGTDKRMDEWVPEEFCTMNDTASIPVIIVADTAAPRKRKRGISRWNVTTTTTTTTVTAVPQSPPEPASSSTPHDPTTNGLTTKSGTDKVDMQPNGSRTHATTDNSWAAEELNLMRPRKSYTPSQRNFDTVVFGEYKIRPWYYSPYPLIESNSEAEDAPPPPPASAPTPPSQRIPKPPRTYSRTSDVLTGGLARQHSTGDATLWVCHFCFKYMMDGVPWELHKDCKLKHPPGKKVYQRGAHTIWEVDGAKEKLYCQNLSLFGKLFIDVKTLFFDCHTFLFYILTDAKPSEDHIVGFFSKEKLSYDDYNLACIMTLPQYQRQGFGMLLIEFSYELSRRAGKVGTPERPLSDLGLRSYLAYWVATLIRFFRRVLSVLPPDIISIANKNEFPQFEEDFSGDVERLSPKKRKKPKGFDGELSEGYLDAETGMCMTPWSAISEPIFTTQRLFETTPNDDGGAVTNVKVECTLEDIAMVTNLRVDDAAFALNECGLLMRRLSPSTPTTTTTDSGNSDDGGGGGGDGGSLYDGSEVVVVTRSLVEKVAKERNVKVRCLDLNCVIP